MGHQKILQRLVDLVILLWLLVGCANAVATLPAASIVTPTPLPAKLLQTTPMASTLPQVERMHTEPVAGAPRTFEESASHAQLVVLAEVVSVKQGPDFMAPIEGTNEVTRHPSQRVLLQIVKTYKGAARPGQKLTLYQGNTGMTEARPAGDQPPTPILLLNENDPPYKVGQRYLLALMAVVLPEQIKKIQPEPWPAGMVTVSCSAGRLLVNPDGTLSYVVADAGGRSIPGDAIGKTLNAIEPLIITPIIPGVTSGPGAASSP